MLKRFAPEIPVLIFWAYFLYLCLVFHSRDQVMLDSVLTFDNWDYFLHRLRNFELAQWNPYHLFGSIAVQWNWVAVSIFTPVLLLTGWTLTTSHFVQITGTFLSFFGLYLMARRIGFGRYLPIIAITFVASIEFYRYYAGWAYQAGYLFLSPLAAAFFLHAARSQTMGWRAWCASNLLLGVAFLNLRLEFMVYTWAFIGVGHLTWLFCVRENSRRRIEIILSALGMFAISLALNAWQLTYLIHSMRQNIRVLEPKGNLAALADPLFQKWFLLGVLQQGPLLGALVLFVLARLTKSLWSRALSLAAYALLGLQIALRLHPIWRNPGNPPGDIDRGVELIFIALLASGACYSALRRKGTTLVWVTVAFLFFNDPGIFIITRVLGLPWLPARADLVTIPFVTLVLCAGLQAWLVGLVKIYGHLIPTLPRVERRVALLLVGTALAGFFLNSGFLPQNQVEYIYNFPFAGTPKSVVEKRVRGKKRFKGHLLHEILKRTDQLASRSYVVNSKKRYHFASIPDPILEVQSRFPLFPSRLGIRNTLPVYSSDIPQNLANIFFETYNRQIAIHPELVAFRSLYARFMEKDFERQGRPRELDYASTVLIDAEAPKASLARTLLAEEGGGTSRFFVTDSVVKFNDFREEYHYLSQSLDQPGHKLEDFITTSDPRFLDSKSHSANKGMTYTIHVTKDLPELIQLNVKARAPSNLAVLDLFDDGWSATVNGDSVPIYRGYIGLRFLQIPAGESNVIMKFRVPGLIWGSLLSLLALLGLTTYLIRSSRPSLQP
ncbi:MAG: hypothetical protein AB7F86_13465 [Bdellovibrionales bacterium]